MPQTCALPPQVRQRVAVAPPQASINQSGRLENGWNLTVGYENHCSKKQMFSHRVLVTAVRRDYRSYRCRGLQPLLWKRRIEEAHEGLNHRARKLALSMECPEFGQAA